MAKTRREMISEGIPFTRRELIFGWFPEIPLTPIDPVSAGDPKGKENLELCAQALIDVLREQDNKKIKMAPLSKNSILSVLYAWETYKAENDDPSILVFSDEYAKKEKSEEEGEGSSTGPVRKVKKEKKKRENYVPSDYQVYLSEWRVANPDIRGKEAMKQGAIAWAAYKKTDEYAEMVRNKPEKPVKVKEPKKPEEDGEVSTPKAKKPRKPKVPNAPKKAKEPTEPKEKKKREPSKYQQFLAIWRTLNPDIKGKKVMQVGAQAWDAFNREVGEGDVDIKDEYKELAASMRIFNLDDFAPK